MLNELKYNINDFKKLDEDDVIIVFKGNVYPIYVHDNSYDNFTYVINIIKKLCSSFDGMYDIFFEDDGKLKQLFRFSPDKLINALGNFEGLPKVLYGYVTEHEGKYALAFDNAMYDVANSQELKQLLKTGITNQFEYILFNDKAYTLEELKKGEFDNKTRENTNIAPTLFHGTTSEFLYSIITKGIRRVAENSYFKGIDNEGLVFLTSVFETAKNYAKMYKMKKGGSTCIIAIDSRKLDANKIVLDYDFATEYTTDYENSPYSGRIKPKNRFYRGDVVKNSGRHGTKFGKIGYKGIVMPNAIKGVYIDDEFYTKEQVLQMYEHRWNISRNGNVLNEYTSRYYSGQENFNIKAYHSVRRSHIVDLWFDGKLDPKAEHNGECPWDVIWFTIKEGDFQSQYQFSFDIDPATFEEFGFKWVNDIHLVCTKPIELMDKRIRINRHGGVNPDEIFENLCPNRTQEEYNEFFDEMFDLTNYEVSNEYFVNKLLQQYNIPKEVYWSVDELGENIKKVRQGMIQYEHCEDILNEVDADDISLKSFEVQDELNPKFWINGKINSRVRLKLLDLADEFFDSLSVNWVKPKDIVLTGSIANYNWSRYSDVDVHILVDFNEVWKKKEFVRDYFDSKKELWLQEHDGLKIYGFPVEIYVEDSNEKNPSSGIYSLNKNKWLVEPNDFQDAELNQDFIKKQSAKLMTEIDEIEEKIKTEKDNHKLEELSSKVKRMFDKLHKQRGESLEKHGEYGVYNIIWKVLRRSGHLDKMWEIINTVYNKINSIK